MKERIVISCRLSVVYLVLVLVLTFTNFTDGRYLPTRADESQVAALKDLITNILDEAQQHEREHELGRERERPQLPARSTRFFSTQSNRARQFARQHYSMRARPTDEDQSNRLLLDAAFLERRSAELMPPLSLVDLDGSDLNPTGAKASTTNQNQQQQIFHGI